MLDIPGLSNRITMFFKHKRNNASNAWLHTRYKHSCCVSMFGTCPVNQALGKTSSSTSAAACPSTFASLVTVLPCGNCCINLGLQYFSLTEMATENVLGRPSGFNWVDISSNIRVCFANRLSMKDRSFTTSLRKPNLIQAKAARECGWNERRDTQTCKTPLSFCFPLDGMLHCKEGGSLNGWPETPGRGPSAKKDCLTRKRPKTFRRSTFVPSCSSPFALSSSPRSNFRFCCRSCVFCRIGSCAQCP